MMDYPGMGMDANAYTLPFFTRFDAKMASAIAKLIGQGDEWPADGTRESWSRRMEREYQDWARLQGRGPHTGGPKGRLVGWRMW